MDLTSGPKLVPAEASAALMITPSGDFLLQRRDDKPDIFFPGWLGCFGGALEGDETPKQGLLRELNEELAFRPSRVQHFSTMGLDFGFSGHGIIPRHFFTVPIDATEIETMVLHEGRAMELVPGASILAGAHVIPYDATAIWQYLSRLRF